MGNLLSSGLVPRFAEGVQEGYLGGYGAVTAVSCCSSPSKLTVTCLQT
jgi:hypothetical protein